MAKLTPTQKLAKIDDAIAKEELAIEASKERIKSLKAERRKSEQEQKQSFANEILKLMQEKGISQDMLLSKLNDTVASEPESVLVTQANTFPSPDVNSGTNFSSGYSMFGNKSE